MILTEKITIKISNKNISYYKKLGYNVRNGDLIEITIDKLPKGSKYVITVLCDTCKTQKSIKYKDYIRITKDDKYYCNKCKMIKTKLTNLEKYGVENVFQSEKIKEKIKRTNLEKYGLEFYQKTTEFIDKIKNTNKNKYGVEFILQNKTYLNNLKYLNKLNTTERIKKLKQTKKVKYSKKFYETANKIHNNKYKYNDDYVNSETKIKILCPIHGIFEQRPKDHIHNKQGCPKCNISKGEEEIKKYLEVNNIKYVYQKSFDDCKYIRKLYFDFYLPDHKMCIEFDGEQHYKSIEHWGGNNLLNIRKIRDNIKNNYCKDNNIKLLRIKYNDKINEKLDKIFETFTR